MNSEEHLKVTASHLGRLAYLYLLTEPRKLSSS